MVIATKNVLLFKKCKHFVSYYKYCRKCHLRCLKCKKYRCMVITKRKQSICFMCNSAVQKAANITENQNGDDEGQIEHAMHEVESFGDNSSDNSNNTNEYMINVNVNINISFENANYINDNTILMVNEMPMETSCVNCKRWTTRHSSRDEKYQQLFNINITEAIIRKTALRRKYCNVSINSVEILNQYMASNEVKLKLCSHCHLYLTLPAKEKMLVTKYAWPAILWKMLSCPNLIKVYDCNLWRLIPLEWREWWLKSVTMLDPNVYPLNIVNNLSSDVVDVTLRKNDLETSIKSGKLGHIMESCNRHLVPIVKCPWGCTEFFHLTGELSLQTIICRFVTGNDSELFFSQTDIKKAISKTIGCRNDYLYLTGKTKEDNLLWNPIWKIAPSVYFKDQYPVFLTCRSHNEGCRKWFLHPPENPFGTMPAKLSDQVSPATIVPRTLKAFKAHQYSHSYNMQEMRCQFNGVDTLSVTDRSTFNNDDNILNQLYESLAIKGREDIRSYVGMLGISSMDVPCNISKCLIDRANDIVPDDTIYNTCKIGSTFIGVNDALNLQKELSKGTTSILEIRDKNGNTRHCHFTAKWPSSIFFVHSTDIHGSPMPCCPKPSNQHEVDTQLLWFMISIHVCVVEMWQNTAKEVKKETEWNGWLLLYATELCYPHLMKKNKRKGPFCWNGKRSKYEKERKILQNMKLLPYEETVQYNLIDEIEENIDLQSHDDNITLHSSLHGSNASHYSGDFSSLNELFDNGAAFEEYNSRGNDSISETESTENINEIDSMNDFQFTFNVDNVNNKVFNISYVEKLFETAKGTITVKTNENWFDKINNDNNINVILFLNTANTVLNESQNDNEPNNFHFGFIPQDIISNEEWELRCICCKTITVNEQQRNWVGNLFCRHGVGLFKNWWNVSSESCFAKKMEEGYNVYNIDESKYGKCIIAVFVHKNPLDTPTYRDTFLKTIGGQSLFICKDHKFPLVVTSNPGNLTCCYPDTNDNGINNDCERKSIYACCPALNCSCCICSFHYNYRSKLNNNSQHIEIPLKKSSYNFFNHNFASYTDLKERLDNEHQNYLINSKYKDDEDNSFSDNSEYNNNLNGIMDPVSTDDLSTFLCSPVINSEIVDNNHTVLYCDEKQNPLTIPCSSAGDGGGLYLSEFSKPRFVGSHVILNNCGKLLARRGIKLKGSKVQQQFIQSIVAKTEGKVVPLLYPEAVLFPSIFWTEHKSDFCPVGAIPCCLLAQDSTLSNNGCASLLDHFRARITNTKLLTSTDYKYISFCFDNYLNLQTRHTHTRLILHRGLWNCGLGKSMPTTKEPMLDVDSIDNRPVVNKLAAAVGETQATYFYTHTCNQQEHFGIKNLKQWIDSKELENIIESQLSHISGLTENLSRYRDELKASILQSSAVTMLRCWMEVSSIWMGYIQNSVEQPLGKVTNIWWRHEYQDSKGNLSHIHALIWVDKNESKETKLDRIRGSIVELIRNDNEVNDLVAEKIMKNPFDIYRVQELASKILNHTCSDRCKRRTGIGINDVRCRVTNNGKENPTPSYHHFKQYDVQYSTNCINILIKLGLMNYDDNTKNYVMHEGLHPIKHFPPAIAAEGNISACNGRLFAACLSNNNLKYVTGYLASRYLAKYVASIDENNRVYLSCNPYDASEINAKLDFLYNTKVTSSKINETNKMYMSKDKNKPRGRAISLTEIIAILLGYPQVYTDIKFIHVPTTPLAERSAVEKIPMIRKTFKKQNNNRVKIDDLSTGDLLSLYYVRNIKLRNELPMWRYYTNCESLLMKDQMFSNLSIDNVTAFGLRPPELRFVRHIKMYYKWFYTEKSDLLTYTFSKQIQTIETIITNNMHETAWIDGIGRKIYLRPYAIDEVLQLINLMEDSDFYGTNQYNAIRDDTTTIFERAKCIVLRLFNSIKQVINLLQDNIVLNEDYRCVALRFLNVSDANGFKKVSSLPVPVIWFSSIKPTQGTRWLIHLLISMGEFENEYSLFCHPSIKDCFISCKLLSKDSSEHENDIKKILKKYIVEQLNYIPGGSKQFDRNIIAAYQTLEHFLLNADPIMYETPLVLYTQIQEVMSTECKNYVLMMKKRLIETTIKKIEQKSTFVLPNLEDIVNATKLNPMEWNPCVSIECGQTQSKESYQEQIQLLCNGCKCIKLLLQASSYCNRNIIICGGPGVGKTTLLQLLILYGASIGCNVNLSSIMSERSSELGGLHLSKMFCIPTDKLKNPSIIAEKAVCALLRSPKQLSLLEKLEILAIDEFGQVSAELLSVIDIILRTIRKSSLFMGGVYVIATMDNMQLPPVYGRPPLLSPQMLTSFSFHVLYHSVRASQDPHLQEIQQITRLNYNELKPSHIKRFRALIENNCTFVDDFNDPLLTIDKLRMFGKKSAKIIAEDKLLRGKRKEYAGILIESIAEDFESTLESQWDTASKTTSRLLSQRVKEPAKLCFYPYAAYEITFNNSTKFSQGQIALLAKMPSLEEVKQFAPVSIFVAPDGCKTFPTAFDSCTLIQQGWHIEQMTKCREHPEFLRYGVQAKRRQYGLRHRIASTIHAGMGQDLPYIVTRVTDKSDDANYHLWDKEQVVVLLSRTNFAKNIIFVGEKKSTSKALSDLLRKRSQFSEYTNALLKTLCNGKHTLPLDQEINLELYPYRAIDFEIPSTSCGYVYLLQSRNPKTLGTCYIGQTLTLIQRLKQHNNLQGSDSTSNVNMLPWALICFITGFNTNDNLRRQNIEQLWKIMRDKLERKNKRILTVEEICNIGKLITQQISNSELRFIRCCTFDNSI